jgi:hypothetical protein
MTLLLGIFAFYLCWSALTFLAALRSGSPGEGRQGSTASATLLPDRSAVPVGKRETGQGTFFEGEA